MSPWFWYAAAAAVLYGAHQIFTRLAADRIGDGLGGFVVEATAALTILGYLLALRLLGRWNQPFSSMGFWYSVLTGLCVGAGTVAFFLLFQRGGPLSAVPAILAGGAAMMAVASILFSMNRLPGRVCLAWCSRLPGCYCCATDLGPAGRWSMLASKAAVGTWIWERCAPNSPFP